MFCSLLSFCFFISFTFIHPYYAYYSFFSFTVREAAAAVHLFRTLRILKIDEAGVCAAGILPVEYRHRVNN